MKKLLLAVLLGVLNLSLIAAETKQAPAPPPATGGFVDRIGFDVVGIARTTHFKKFAYSAGVRVGYDLSDRLGVVIEASGGDTHGTLVESTFAGVKLGLPIKAIDPVVPYLIGGGGLRFQGSETEEYLGGGAGLALKLGKNVRVFIEATAETGGPDVPFKGVAGVGFRF